MRIAFLASTKPRERLLADAFLHGARKHGHETQMIPLTGEAFVGEYDVACFVGVKSRELYFAHLRAGVPFLQFDKGYSRHGRTDGVAGWEYWRVAFNAHQPTDRLNRKLPTDRMEKFGWHPKPWRRDGDHIILAGSSAKYHEFYRMREPTSWMHHVVNQIRAVTLKRPLIYRPKPSWREAVEIPHTQFSRPPEVLADLFPKAWALVTHGSNASFDAVMAGIPCIILGEAVAKPLSSTSILDIDKPLLADDKARRRWLAALAYHQWTLPELHSGVAWDFIGAQIHG